MNKHEPIIIIKLCQHIFVFFAVNNFESDFVTLETFSMRKGSRKAFPERVSGDLERVPGKRFQERVPGENPKGPGKGYRKGFLESVPGKRTAGKGFGYSKTLMESISY